MLKAKKQFYAKIKYLMFAIIAISGLLFFAGAFENPESLISIATVIPLAWITSDKKFKELSDEEFKALDDDSKIAYFNAKNAHYREMLNSKIESKADTSEIEKLKKEISDIRDVQFKEVNRILELQGAALARVPVVKGENKKSLKDAITETAKKLKETDNGHGYYKVDTDVKTVGTMTFTASVTGQIPQADREPGITNIPRRQFFLRAASNVTPTNSNLVEWVEQQNIEGGAGNTSEGTKKTQLDWEWIVKNEKVEKITSFVKISKEMLDDIDGIMAEINGNLVYQIELQEETQLKEGNGTSPQINGIELYAQPLDLAALAGTVDSPNNWDVLGAAITQIIVNGNGNFYPNAIYVNPVDFFLSIHNSKATTNEYVNPVTVVPNAGSNGLPNVYVWGVPMYPSNTITAGEFLVGDFNKFHIRDKEGIQIQMGWESDDFVKNLVTILGEKRLATYVKANEVEAFVTDTFADGIAFIELAS